MRPRPFDAPDDRGAPPGAEDPSIVPGLVPGGPLDMSQDPDRFDPTRPAVPSGPLDMSQDPDRFDPTAQPVVVGPLDMSQDPDRMPEPGRGQSLTDLLGKDRSYEDDRDGYEWVVGLLAVIAFLAAVAFVFNNVLSP